jgi:hypothetical protein
VDADKHIDSLLPASVLVGVGVISAYCWVLREHASVSSLGKNLQAGTAGHTAVGTQVSAGLVFAHGFPVVCCLRTAQWTRASLL